MTRPSVVTSADRLGPTEAYAMARLTPGPGHLMTCSAIFEDYRAWCQIQGLVPLREGVFIDALEALAREAGIPIRQRGSNLTFVDVTLVDHPTI